MADKHNIPKGEMNSNCDKEITWGEHTPVKLLNEEIPSDINKQNLWKEHLDAHWDHMYTTHIIWKTIQCLSNRAPATTLNNSITFNNKITAKTPKYCELFHLTIHKHCQTRNTQDKQIY